MYYSSVEQESNFWVDLIKSHDPARADGTSICVRRCPLCQKGDVLTHCTSGMENGRIFWRFDHRCSACGEIFDLSRMRADIFFNLPYEMKEGLKTPFGVLQVKVNNRVVPFRYRCDIDKNAQGAITVHIIDIDLSDLRIGDYIFCGFDRDMLEYDDSDERSVLFSYGDDKVLLSLCAYAPEESEEDLYCYQYEYGDAKGFWYKVTKDPKEFDARQMYDSKIISLALAWIEKKDFDNADSELFCALTCVIG